MLGTKYNLSFMSSKALTRAELELLLKKQTKQLLNAPFGEWRPETPDQPVFSHSTLNKEVDPLLGHNKGWLATVILEHIHAKAAAHDTKYLTIQGMKDLQYSLTRLDTMLGHSAPDLEHIRNICKGLKTNE